MHLLLRMNLAVGDRKFACRLPSSDLRQFVLLTEGENVYGVRPIR
jgi:hypothetical protein